MKGSVNEYSQLVELAFTAEIFWHERGDKTQGNEAKRSLRDFALIFNPEVRY